MATCRQIITTALRKARQIGAGDNPSAEDAATALPNLQSFYDELIGLGKLGVLTDVLVTAAYTAGENQRISNTTTTPWTITLPLTVTDRYTNLVRPVRDRTLVVVAGTTAGATPGNYLFSAQRGAWDRMSNLSLDDYAPLSERAQDGLASIMAMRLIEEYGGQPTVVLQRQSASFLSMLSHKRDSQRVETRADYF